VIYVKTTSNIDSIKINIIDVKINGDWQNNQFPNNEFIMFKMDDEYFELEILKIDDSDQYAIYIKGPFGYNGSNKFTLNGKVVNRDSVTVNGQNKYCYVIKENGRAIYTCTFRYTDYEITWTVSEEIIFIRIWNGLNYESILFFYSYN